MSPFNLEPGQMHAAATRFDPAIKNLGLAAELVRHGDAAESPQIAMLQYATAIEVGRTALIQIHMPNLVTSDMTIEGRPDGIQDSLKVLDEYVGREPDTEYTAGQLGQARSVVTRALEAFQVSHPTMTAYLQHRQSQELAPASECQQVEGPKVSQVAY